MSSKISIIIVNYNVKAFLEQCLYAVFNASKHIETEIIVVDNNSVDDSVEMMKKNFPQVKIICNEKNMGFAFACNQALRISDAKYALLLNPDTIIREDCLDLCTEFMDEHAEAGALGVKMIDGKGKFLPESKRSVPTARSAFYKIFGLSSIFPKSKKFGKYQLKYLDENQIHEVEVLSGAFMFIRKSVLDQIGHLDESFFMYGEDIDLSYRIIKAGYKNYYFPKTTIIHFKGESTKKASFRYVKFFYQAMLIFSEKHYKGSRHSIFRLIIRFAIYIRAAISIFRRICNAIYLPILDFTITYLVYKQIVPLWESYKFFGARAYSGLLIEVYIPVYIIIWMLLVKYFKAYTPYAKLNTLTKAIFWGTAFILAAYSLLPEDYRFSRALILIGATACLAIFYFNRLTIRFLNNYYNNTRTDVKKSTLLIGHTENKDFNIYPAYLEKEFEIKKVLRLSSENSENALLQVPEIINIYKINTIIFLIKDINTSDIINTIIHNQSKNIAYKMILPLSTSMVGPQSVVDIDTIPEFRLSLISDFNNRLKKRSLDLSICLIMTILLPVFLIRNKLKNYLSILFSILLNQMSWVSYIKLGSTDIKDMPELKPGVFSPLALSNNHLINKEEINMKYAKYYKVKYDIIIVYRALKNNLNLDYHLKINK